MKYVFLCWFNLVQLALDTIAPLIIGQSMHSLQGPITF